MLANEDVPGILLGLLDAQADATLVCVDIKDFDIHFLAGRDDLAGMHILARPAHLGHVDKTLDPRLQLHKGAIVGDVGDAALEACTHGILGGNAFPGIGFQLLHTKADALGFRVETDDLHTNRLSDAERFGGMVDAPPGNVRDMEQAVEAAQIHERTVIGDVLDDTVEYLAFGQAGNQVGALIRTLVFQHGTARNHDIAAASIHLQNAEFVLIAHQRRDIAHGADIDLAARQEGQSTIHVDGETALHTLNDVTLDPVVRLERLLKLVPDLFTLCLLARQDDLAIAVFQPLDKNLDHVANTHACLATRRGKLTQGHATLGLEADINQDRIALNGHDGAVDDCAFDDIDATNKLVEKIFKILFGRRCILRHACVGHVVSWIPWEAFFASSPCPLGFHTDQRETDTGLAFLAKRQPFG